MTEQCQQRWLQQIYKGSLMLQHLHDTAYPSAGDVLEHAQLKYPMSLRQQLEVLNNAMQAADKRPHPIQLALLVACAGELFQQQISVFKLLLADLQVVQFCSSAGQAGLNCLSPGLLPQPESFLRFSSFDLLLLSGVRLTSSARKLGLVLGDFAVTLSTAYV